MTTAKTPAPQVSPSLSRSPWPVFAVCAISFYVVMFDLAIVNVAFPDILADFDVSRADGSWMVSLYNIFFGSLLVVAGKTADSVGRRKVLRLGIAAFGTGAAISAFAPGLAVLLVGRGVQGIGAALMTPAALGLAVAAFSVENRTQTMARWSAVGAAGVSSAPSLGAAIIQIANWRAAFWIPFLLCSVLLLVSGRVLVESATSQAEHKPDYFGAALVTAALAALVLGVSRSGSWGWTNPATLIATTAGVIAVGVFVARQRSHPEPILDLTLFRSRAFTVASFSGLVFFGSYSAYNLNNVLFLRQAWGYTVLEAGLIALIGPVTVTILSPTAGRVATRFGFRLPAIAGALFAAAGAIGLATSFTETRQPALFMTFVALLGVGIALFIAANAGAGVAELPPERLSIGGAASNALRQIGAAFGVALLVVVVGTPDSPLELVDAHSNGYVLVAITMGVAALLNLAQTGRRAS